MWGRTLAGKITTLFYTGIGTMVFLAVFWVMLRHDRKLTPIDRAKLALPWAVIAGFVVNLVCWLANAPMVSWP